MTSFVARAGLEARGLALAAICIAACVWPVNAQAPLPALTTPVNDFAKVVDAGSAAELDRIIRVLQASTGDVVVVATVETFAPYATIEEYALRLFEKAGIGARKTDSGALVLLAVRDRRVRIEVGYGLEEFITDGFAGETIRTEMLPAFREGGYGPGLVAGTTRVIQRIARGRGVTLDTVVQPARPQPQPQSQRGLPIPVIVLALIIFALINKYGGTSGGITPYGRRGGRSTWSGWHGGLGGFGGGFGGGGGGGFGGFGGGRSGGGGASGGW